MTNLEKHGEGKPRLYLIKNGIIVVLALFATSITMSSCFFRGHEHRHHHHHEEHREDRHEGHHD